MDLETLAICKKKLASATAAAAAANAAAEEATEAAINAEEAVAAIYHDKNFLLTVNDDNSLSLIYQIEETEE